MVQKKRISNVLVDSEEPNGFRLKETIRAKDDHLSDMDEDRLMEFVKRIEQNQRQDLKFKTYKTKL